VTSETCSPALRPRIVRQRGAARRLALAACAAVLGLSACRAPRAGMLRGTPTTQRLPETALPAGYRRQVFRWEYRDALFTARGDGVARVAPPDSVRLDFFADGGMGGGFAIIIGDSLFVPGGSDAKRYLPPVPMLWAALGKLIVAAPDTTTHMDGDTLRADIGHDPTWRVAFAPRGLIQIEHLAKGRIVERVTRSDTAQVEYRHNGARRTLRLSNLRTHNESGFDAAIWKH
jgi:hypothetical protein